jgi:hypothetical protein
MSKYAALTKYLEKHASAEEVRMELGKIQDILGFPLPNSARLYYAWWDNSGSGGHSQAKAWLNAGFETANVNLKQSPLSVVFVRTHKEASVPRVGQENDRHPAFGAWKGRVTLLPDYDYTQPADPDWGKVYEE